MTFAVALIVAAQTVPLAVPAATSPAADDWVGTLTLPSQAQLRVAVHLRTGRDGTLVGSFDSLDQRIWNIALDGVARTRTTLGFSVPGNGGRYAGRWDPRPDRHSGFSSGVKADS